MEITFFKKENTEITELENVLEFGQEDEIQMLKDDTIIKPEETRVLKDDTIIKPQEARVLKDDTTIKPQETRVLKDDTTIKPEETRMLKVPIKPQETRVPKVPIKPQEARVLKGDTTIKPQETRVLKVPIIKPQETRVLKVPIIIFVNENHISLHQYSNGLLFKTSFTYDIWLSLLRKNSDWFSKLTVVFTINGDPQDLKINIKYLTGSLLYGYRGKIPIRWKTEKLQIKFLNEYNNPLHIKEFDSWLEYWSKKGNEQKEEVMNCINVINYFVDTTMRSRDCCDFNVLKIVGSFRQLYYIQPDWKLGKWKPSGICTRGILSDNINPYLNPYTETVSAFFVASSKKIIICNAQFQNLIFTGNALLSPELVIKNCEVSYIALRRTIGGYLELDLSTSTSAPSVNVNKGSYIVDMASFPKSSDSWVVMTNYSITCGSDYYVFKNLPPPPPLEFRSSEPSESHSSDPYQSRSVLVDMMLKFEPPKSYHPLCLLC
jgi:hypothetical protein